MKIGIEAQRLFRRKKHGMDIVVLELIKNLQKIDKKNEYIIFVKPDVDKCIEETKNFKINYLKSKNYFTWEQFALPRAAEKEKCDILHCTSNTAPLKTKIPIIVTIHDIIYLESLSIFKKGGTWYQKLGNMYRRWIVPTIANNAKKIITVSEFEKKRINKFFKFNEKNNKLSAIYNGFGKHFEFIGDKVFLEKIKKKYNLPKKFFFFLGNTDPKKNITGVLKAYNLFLQRSKEKISLVILDFKKSELKKILKEINAENLIQNINLLDYVPNTELPGIYNLCEIFLYPSLRESFGIPILEAMACGAPVITSNTSSMPEISKDASILINPYKFEEITKAIFDILENENLKNIKIKKGLERIKLFSWNNMAKKVLSLYETIKNEN